MSDEQNNNSQAQLDEMFLIDFEQVEQVSAVFFEESKEILENLEEQILKLEENPDDVDQINLIFRKVHTLKGSVGAVPGGQLLGSLSHEFEALLNRIKQEQRSVTRECVDLFLQSSRLLKVLAEALREKREVYPEELSEAIETITRYGSFQFSGQRPTPRKAAPPKRAASHSDDEQGVWLSMKQLNEMLKISGELLVLKNFFNMMNQTVNFRTQPELFERRQNDFSHNLTKICDQFQGQIQGVRKERAEESFQGIPVLIRQAATELNKQVHFEMHGMDLMLDKSLAKELSDCVVHLARNSIDHGIEDQFERTVSGKPSIGQLSLEISDKNGIIHLIFKDDGVGLNRERILQRALSTGLLTEEEAVPLTDEQVYRFIFNAGFSTKDKITTISGRGVGMDVVQNTVDSYEGKIHIETTLGQGTSFHLEIPVPQHIMVESALLCTWSDYQLAVPLMSVSHITSCDQLHVTTVNHLRYCQYGGMTVPLLNYHEMLNLSVYEQDEKVKSSSAVFVRCKEATFALLVDKIDGQTDLVVKSFGKIINQQKGFKGISILADEKVTYIVDPELLLAVIAANHQAEAA
ncbi:chemotaxis protein CheA [Bdellovibrio svalbardensis]|uniref:histidine kinase n=1 Tax=Bdellovibrio svalbardensis TaxID=2972972 RepID=A0ABT6DLN3_9BACT|nr:chemotaxis protein CheW [Bdellovibrio svalbardensis]MDG0816980.1 chemotaxis protein CheW [Bdellovibrio svalbardensis]